MPFLHLVRQSAVAAALAGSLLAQTPVVSATGESMRLRSGTVAAGAGGSWNVTLTMENDNANSALATSWRRAWHCQIANLNAAGTTLNVSVTNAGYSDVILPVWALSTNGTSFAPYTRCPTSAVPTVNGAGTTHTFTLLTPPGTVAIRLAKYFPYTVTRKNAFVAQAGAHPRVRSVTTLGNSAQGRPIQMLEITDTTVPDLGKKRIWVHTAVHPNETPAFFVMEGLVGWLLSGDPYAEHLLDRTIVDVVPMANPDGVFLGNYRTTSTSVNLEDEWAPPYASTVPEIVALRTKIEQFMGTPASPGSNPIEILLNLHSSHNIAYPFHFQHVANASWTPGANGVIPAVNALEGQWIAAFRNRSPFVNLGTTQSSTMSGRPFVESMMHDRWSANPLWLGPKVMAITLEGTHWRGPDTVTWNTEADYVLCGQQMGRAMFDYLGLALTASALTYGASCRSELLTGSIAPQGNGNLATLSLSGAAPGSLGWLVLGFQQVTVPLPAPWQNCNLLCSLDGTVSFLVNGAGAGQVQLGLPYWPGLVAFTQCVTADLNGPAAVLDTSNGVRLQNDF
jgi:hypothetical protein